ncbi:hypothetical protein RclHR1_39450001, partial [Rhizophagus clarus]
SKIVDISFQFTSITPNTIYWVNTLTSIGDEMLVPETNRENVQRSWPIMLAVEHERSSLTTTAKETLEINVQPPKSRKSCEDMLIKQGRQIRALYELHKEMLEKLEFENWLNQHHPDYLREVGYREWMNVFSGCHHSMLMRKMKDIRGVHVATVKSAIFKEFSLQSISDKIRINTLLGFIQKKGGFTIHDAQEILREKVSEIPKTGSFKEEEETNVILRGDDSLMTLHDDLFYDD